jgi:hypothetical protein
LLPSELFPTDIRAVIHGFCAACGKLGALIATLWFSLGDNGGPVSPEYIFKVNGYVSLIGLILTIFLIPNTGNVSLHEVHQHWENKLLDKPYEGPATEKTHLSIIEILFLKKGQNQKKNDGKASEAPVERESLVVT